MSPAGASGALTPPGSFFKERWRLLLCSEPQQLCRDFCVSLQQGRFLLLATCTPLATRQAAAAAAAAAAPTPAAAAGHELAAGGRLQLQQQQQDGTGGAGAGGQASNQQRGDRLPSNDCCDVITFHVVRANPGQTWRVSGKDLLGYAWLHQQEPMPG